MTVINIAVFWPWALVSQLIRVLFRFNIFHSVLKDKKSPYLTMGLMFLFDIPFIWLASFFVEHGILNEYIPFLFLMVSEVLILHFFTEGKLFTKIFLEILSHILWTFLNAIGVYLICLTNDHEFENIMYGYEMYLYEFVTVHMSALGSSFVLAFIFRFIRSKLMQKFKYDAKYIFYILFPITHIMGIYLLCYTWQTVEKLLEGVNFAQNEILIVIYAVICIVIDVAMIFLIDRQAKMEQENAEYEKMMMQNEIVYAQAQIISQEKLHVRKLKHDMANVISAAKGFIEMDNTEKALNVLQKASDDISSVNGIILCSNETINTIISMKKGRADTEGCVMNVNVDEECGINVDDYDLCRVLMNLIDNGLNAASVADDKALNIDISVSPETVLIKTSNAYVKKKNIVSAPGHGYGTGIISEICRKYDGSYKKSEIDGIYYTETLLSNVKNSR